MKAYFELKNIIHSIDGEDYKSYQKIEGVYLFKDYTLYIDHIQTSPSGCIGNIRARMTQSVALFPSETYSNRSREIALRDFITRAFYNSTENSHISKLISIHSPGQEILERTTAFINKSFVEIRFTISLPSFDNLVEANPLEEVFFDKLPQIIKSSIVFQNLDQDSLYNHIETSEDADFLRNELENLRLIAFIAEGSILSAPNSESKPTPFVSPDTLKMDVELPNKGQITGMGLLRGITLIVGEDGNGKSTLLKAIEQGIYNHIPGDGREYVVSNPNSVKIRVEDGRSIHNLDISAFIKNLSSGENVNSFSTNKAESYISQAANLIEAVEVGADVLLIDEDSSDDSFLYRSIKTENNLSQVNEFVTPFVDKARSLYNEYMVSSILAIKQPEDYFSIANFVIKMSHFEVIDMTEEAKKMAQQNDISDNSNSNFGTIKDRIPLVENLDMIKGSNDIEVAQNKIGYLQYKSDLIDIKSIEQLVTESQKNAVRDAIEYAKKYMDGKKSFRQVTSLVMLDIGRLGLDILNPRLLGNYAEFRKIEFAAVINRLTNLKVD